VEGLISNDSIDFDKLIDSIKQFSLSLICLLLDLAHLNIFNRNNIIKLQQWLESMIKLKQFYFYAKLIGCLNIDEIISMKLQNEY
jgi:hypothetical protein